MGSIVSLPLSMIVAAEAAEAASPSEAKKPFAPLENLLPAVRVKFTIDKAITLTRSLVETTASENGGDSTATTNNSNIGNTLEQLENILLEPQNYVQPNLELWAVPSKPAGLYLKSYRSLAGDLPFQKLLVESGDVDAWKRLKRREKKLEKSSPIREALNAYTDALSFSGDSYLLTADSKTRSSLIREDKLPEIKQVITSDMGMRYLYRNQVLTAMDDVRAEFEYRSKQQQRDQNSESKEQSGDWKELSDLLGLAGEAMDRWLSLAPSGDVEEALKSVASEERYKLGSV